MFPTGTAGVALLLLRLAVAATLILDFVRYCPIYLPAWSAWGIAIVVVPLVVGVFTPLMSALCGLIELLLLSGVGIIEWPALALSMSYAAALGLLVLAARHTSTAFPFCTTACFAVAGKGPLQRGS